MDRIDIPSPLGHLALRAEQESDQDFRFQLFCHSRLPEWQMAAFEPNLLQQLMRHQFHAQAVSYLAQFPRARFDIVEMDGTPIGRIVVDRSGPYVRLVDQAIMPPWRRRGIGTSIMTSLTEEAAKAGIAVRLNVASGNDPSMRLYLRLGFQVIETTEMNLEMEWRQPGPAH